MISERRLAFDSRWSCHDVWIPVTARGWEEARLRWKAMTSEQRWAFDSRWGCHDVWIPVTARGWEVMTCLLLQKTRLLEKECLRRECEGIEKSCSPNAANFGF
jgi:hypothetical protein